MLNKIETFLDREMRITEFTDSSHNGVQVENSGRIRKVCFGVDASLEFFVEARKRGADMVVCHHGLSWGDSLSRITELNYKRVSFLIRNDMALYACHLPLDAHPRYGNNAIIARLIGLTKLKKFGEYNGMEIGFEGILPRSLKYESFKKLVVNRIGGELRTMDFGPEMVRTAAVVSGGAAGEIAEAGRKQIDVFLSGEPKLAAYSMAQEWGINAVFAGHYATEVFGVKELSTLIGKKFGLKTEFIDLGVPY